jgi:hypothetical protein
MKSTIFNRLAPLALLLAGGAALAAQDAPGVRYGAALSLVNPMGDLGGDEMKDEKALGLAGPGFSLGAFFEAPIVSGLSLRGTLEYAVFGGKDYEESGESYPGGPSYSYKWSYSLSHVGVVVDALWYFDEARSFYAFAGLGAYYRPVDASYGDRSYAEALEDGLGLNLGAGYWFTKNLGAELRYIMATGPDPEEDYYTGQKPDKPDTSWLQVSFKYRF